MKARFAIILASVIVTSVLSSTIFVACGEFNGVVAAESEKVALLSSAKIFSATQADADRYMSQATQTSETAPVPPEPPPVVPPPSPVAGSATAQTICSNVMTQNRGYNLASIQKPIAHIKNAAGTDECTFDGTQIKNRLINMSQVTLESLQVNCPNMTEGTHFLAITEEGKSGNVLFHATQHLAGIGGIDGVEQHVASKPGMEFSLTKDARTGQLSFKAVDQTWVLLTFNGGRVTGTATGENQQVPATPAQCEVNRSPLIVQISDGYKTRPIVLTPPQYGIKFDILGENAPTPHQKMNISWFANSQSASYNYWIVLPDASGKVGGIDQMFGDNTLGPDGTFAANGFDALKKWDGRTSQMDSNGSFYSKKTRDDKIDVNDAVFSQLRLWFDRNLDGVASEDELIALSKAGVSSIDLNYDSKFAETDIYGNQIKYKSVMSMKDGRLNIVYDLWFRLP